MHPKIETDVPISTVTSSGCRKAARAVWSNICPAPPAGTSRHVPVSVPIHYPKTHVRQAETQEVAFGLHNISVGEATPKTIKALLALNPRRGSTTATTTTYRADGIFKHNSELQQQTGRSDSFRDLCEKETKYYLALRSARAQLLSKYREDLRRLQAQRLRNRDLIHKRNECRLKRAEKSTIARNFNSRSHANPTGNTVHPTAETGMPCSEVEIPSVPTESNGPDGWPGSYPVSISPVSTEEEVAAQNTNVAAASTAATNIVLVPAAVVTDADATNDAVLTAVAGKRNAL